MKRSDRRILTTHTGSLPRPEGLVEDVLARSESDADHPDLDHRVRAAVGDAVARQIDAGIDVVSDGEMSKVGFADYVKERLTGFEGQAREMLAADIADFPELTARLAERKTPRRRSERPANTGPISYRSEAVEADIDNLTAAVADARVEEAFMPAVSPGCVAQLMPTEHFATRDEYLSALADALAVEYRAIADAGFVLQIDCPDLAMGRTKEFRDLPLDEYQRLMRVNVEVLNHALTGIDPEQVRVHVCWGNYPGPHHLDVPLRDIVDLVLEVNAHGVSVEAANPRHEHEWKVWEVVTLPSDRFLIPGVIDSLTTYIEHPEVVAQRLARYTGVVGRERVVAGTDCGFGTFAGRPHVVSGVAYAKLAAMAEGARLLSTELW